MPDAPPSSDIHDASVDRRLIRAYLDRRDEASFVELYRTHTASLYRMAWRLAAFAPEIVEDLVQETWLRAASRLHTFRFDSALRTWLIGILIRCASDRRRRDRRESAPQPLTDEPSERMTPHLAIDLERAIAGLPEGMREVFLLHDLEGLTHAEIGECLGIAAGTSKSQLFAARQRLRLWLGRTEHGT